MMQKNPSHLRSLAFLIMLVITPLLLASCASGGSGKYRTHTHYPPGFSSYYYRPWGGYRPIIIDGRDREIDPDWSVPPPRGVPPQTKVSTLTGEWKPLPLRLQNPCPIWACLISVGRTSTWAGSSSQQNISPVESLISRRSFTPLLRNVLTRV